MNSLTQTSRHAEADVRELIKQLVFELAPTKEQVTKDNPDLVADLEYHSLAVLELAFSIEDEFDLEPLDEETAKTIPTLYDVQDYVVGRLIARGELEPATDSATEN